MTNNAYTRHINVRETSQNQPILGKNQVKNNTGGYVFQVSDKARLERFLILGTEGGSFYVGEPKLTRDNADFLIKMIKTDIELVAEVVKDVSANNRAKKTSPAIFATAALFQFGDNNVLAKDVFKTVVRTSTHLFEFSQYIKNLGGWSRAKRTAIKNWYESKSDDQLAYQMVKYRGGRHGWTHADVLRVSHAKPSEANARFALGKDLNGLEEVPMPIAGLYEAQSVKTAKDAVRVLNEYKNLPWEVLPTEMHKEPSVWKALFNNGMKGMALVRNITRLARLGMFNDLDFAKEYANRILADVETAGIHPISYLQALIVHQEGQGINDPKAGYWNFEVSRKKDWDTSAILTEALEEAFYESFKYVQPTGKRIMLALDVSGSMSSAASGMKDLSCAQVSAAIAMLIARTEDKYIIKGFSHGLTDLGITSHTSLSEAMNKISNLNFGATDASLAFQWARENKVALDGMIIITDNQTNTGRMHPVQAQKKYRNNLGLDTRLVVMGVAANEFSVADPDDGDSLDVVGFDSAAPAVVTDFIAGRI